MVRIAPQRDHRISIHAPREGSDRTVWRRLHCAVQFQSTLPARGATRLTAVSALSTCYFNPRSPRGERRSCRYSSLLVVPFQSTLPARGATPPGSPGNYPNRISIHAPREGSDIVLGRPLLRSDGFQSTLPARGATRFASLSRTVSQFQSTLPARGATPWGTGGGSFMPYFNPRSPRGERPYRCCDGN